MRLIPPKNFPELPPYPPISPALGQCEYAVVHHAQQFHCRIGVGDHISLLVAEDKMMAPPTRLVADNNEVRPGMLGFFHSANALVARSSG